MQLNCVKLFSFVVSNSYNQKMYSGIFTFIIQNLTKVKTQKYPSIYESWTSALKDSLDYNDINKCITHQMYSKCLTLEVPNISCLTSNLYLGKMPLHNIRLIQNLRVMDDWKEFWRKQEADFYNKYGRWLHLDEDLQVTPKLERRKKILSAHWCLITLISLLFESFWAPDR